MDRLGRYRPGQAPTGQPAKWSATSMAGKVAFRLARLLPNRDGAATAVASLWVLPDDHIHIGRWSYFDGVPAVHCYPGAEDERIEVGAFCSLAKDLTFILSGNHDWRRVTTSPVRHLFGVEEYATSGEISGRGGVVIGNDVWIGRGALLLSGARIGDGAVVGAGAVVSGKVAPYAIVAGNPAHEIRRRFDPPTVDRLLASAWWELTDTELLAAVDLLSSQDVTAFLDHVEAARAPVPTEPAIDLTEATQEQHTST